MVEKYMLNLLWHRNKMYIESDTNEEHIIVEFKPYKIVTHRCTLIWRHVEISSTASTGLVKGDTEHRYTANLLNCKLYMTLFVDVSVHMAFFIWYLVPKDTIDFIADRFLCYIIHKKFEDTKGIIRIRGWTHVLRKGKKFLLH